MTCPKGSTGIARLTGVGADATLTPVFGYVQVYIVLGARSLDAMRAIPTGGGTELMTV